MLAILLATLPVAQAASGPQEPLRYWIEGLAALRRTDGRHGTLGPTGKRLWATRLAPRPGLLGQVHYLHHSPRLRDPLRVDLTDANGARLLLEVRDQSWQPTHSTVRYGVRGRDGVEVVEQRWIEDSDVYVSRLTTRGLGRFGVLWQSPLARTADDGRAFQAVPLHGVANVDLLTATVLRRGGDLAPVWIEGEQFDRQVGSRGVDRKRAASGGEVLGLEFGGEAGHEAAWGFMATGKGAWSALVRYARARAGAAEFAVRLGDREVGRLTCAPTGGWGNAEREFAFARIDLGEIPAGWSDLSITAVAAGGSTNIDGLLVLPTDRVAAPPARAQWAGLDPLRGGIRLTESRLIARGVPFATLAPVGGQGVHRPGHKIAVPGRGQRLHVLAVPVGPKPRVRCGDTELPLGPRALELTDNVTSLEVPAEGDLELVTHDCVVVAASREAVPAIASHVRRGRIRLHGVSTQIRAGLHGAERPWRIEPGPSGRATLTLTLEFSGDRLPGAATREIVARSDPLGSHRLRYAQWFARNAPRLETADALLENVWVYRWFLVRHNLAYPEAGLLPNGPVIYEGRHNSWYPRVISFSTPHIVSEARWLADRGLWLGNVLAHVALQGEDGVFPNALVNWRGFRYINWIPHAAVHAFKARPDRDAMARLLPALLANVDGTAARFDSDGDGLLAPGDHYTTGMEFQPSFWAHSGYDNTKPQTQLERPDFNAYLYGNASALAEAAVRLERADDATRMSALAARTRDAVITKLWHAEDRFFYSLREKDDAVARCKEVIGFYPFRFGLPPDDGRFAGALNALVDPAEFWTAFPIASCSKKVPVYSAAVQKWPGPGGLVTPCMWNGPTWPHANSLVADAMAAAVRGYRQQAVSGAKLGEFLRSFARFHCEDGDPAKPLVREYGDGETGVTWGCADYMHSTFNDLIIRHAAGLQPEFGDDLVVRPIATGFAPFEIHDIPYHGHQVGIRVARGKVRVSLDGEVLGEGEAKDGLFLGGFVR